MKILVVEDDEFTASMLKTILSRQNYAVEVAVDGQSGRELVEAFDYDLVLMDYVLPKLDGINLCRQLRSLGYRMPIVLLTSRDSGHDKAMGLDAGADDYIVKPFDPEELVARIRALLRRGGAAVMPVLVWGELKLDPSTCTASYGDRPLQLTPKEYSLLEVFLRNHHRVFSCSALLDHIWSYKKPPSEEAVRTQIKGLRHKLKAVGADRELIETVYGIGYRLKPIAGADNQAGFESQEHPNEHATDSNPDRSTRQQIQAGLSSIWARFKHRVSEQVETIEKAAAGLEQRARNFEDVLASAIAESHTLAGSLATFGFHEGSRLSRQIEQILTKKKIFTSRETAELQNLVAALRLEIGRDLPPEHRLDSVNPSLDGSTLSDRDLPLLLVIDRDLQSVQELSLESNSWGIRVDIATNLAIALDKIERQTPSVVLLDLSVSDSIADSLSLLSSLSQRTPPIPVLVFSDRGNISERLEVAKLGGRTFLRKPAQPAQVLDAVSQILRRMESLTARVVAVDDDPKVLAVLRTLLEPWGLKLVTLSDPTQLLELLDAYVPDLLILDIEMPNLNGIELCQIVRNDSRWSSLPILFLTAHTDPQIVNTVFAVGADDFVCKPIVGPELVTRIINRLDRIKLIKRMAEIDPLTKVANRHTSTQTLEEYLHLAQRNQQPVCFAILDLDCFKQVNDLYGHAAGDLVLCHVGQLLNRSLRSEDSVARWGGEEFAIGMYGMTKQDGVQRLTTILNSLRSEKFTAPSGDRFQVTFSAGVAQYPEDGLDLQSLYLAADLALYQAKKAGRDRISPTNTEPKKESEERELYVGQKG
ncbi:response regulator [Pseudanabaena sp. PCC 6802]|uniref:response regulator n=1 Tax=Pseudanabaena sp. PCC 6802 TaxID=118173 RepID=UPI000348699B|nr:response regulator [Pseudanabaena sp. PCC 6802]